MAFRLSTDTRNRAADAVANDFNASGAARLYIYTGAQVTNVGDSETGTLLATLTFSGTAFGSASNGICTANPITSGTAGASGTAGHFVIRDGSGNVIADGTCGQGSGDLSLDNAAIVAAATVSISSMTLTMPVY